MDFKKKTLLGLITTSILGFSSFNYFYFNNYSNRSQIYSKKGNNNRIYISKWEKADLSNKEKIRDKIWSEMMNSNKKKYFSQINNFEFEIIKKREFIESLENKIKTNQYKLILNEISKELKTYNIDIENKYKINPIYSINDLKNNSNSINIVNSLGNEIKGKINLKKGNKKLNILKYNMEEHIKGEVTSKINYNIGGKILIKTSNIYIKNERDKFSKYYTLFSEILHKELINTKKKYMENKFKKLLNNKNNLKRYEVDDIIFLANIIDEAVVHSIAQNWILKNHTKFKIPIKSYYKDVKTKNKQYKYLGTKIIRNEILNKGISRKKIILEYIKSPKNFEKDIIFNIDEYQDRLIDYVDY